MPSSPDPFSDRRLIVGAGLALGLANVRYWSTVAPVVRRELARWKRRAERIEDPGLRRLAVSKLQAERFNVQVAATFATVAPRSHRGGVTKAIVALQLIYDYLDLLTEQPGCDPLLDGRLLFAALLEPLVLDEPPLGSYFCGSPWGDGGYLEDLVALARLQFSRLPGAAVVAAVAQTAAKRCAEAQLLSHAAPLRGVEQLELWARREATGSGLGWPEYATGAASSVLAIHAMVAAAAEVGMTPADAERLDAVYLSIGALTMLDSVIDRARDQASGQFGFAELRDTPEAIAAALVAVAKNAALRARGLSHEAHHVMTLVGVVAYYTSAATATSAFATPVSSTLRTNLRPLITPTLAVMRIWRLAKRVQGAPCVSAAMLRLARGASERQRSITRLGVLELLARRRRRG